MQLRLSLLLMIAAGMLLAVPAAASAYFVHTVAAGESLSSIAAQDGLSVEQLAAANGLSPQAELTAGSSVQIPPQQPGVSVTPSSSAVTSGSSSAGDGDVDTDDVGSTATATGATGGSYVVQPGDTLSAIAARAGMTVDQLAALNGLNPNSYLISGTALQLSGGAGSTAPGTAVPATATTGGSYVVQPGDTLSAIAARAGMTVDQLAALNGLNPNSYLISGTALRLGGGSGPVYVSSETPASSVASSQPVGAAAEGSVTDPPYPTPERVTAPEVGSIATANGVPASLADAIAWQESGFNNDLVSSADARGVMQILPGTWQYIQSNLDPQPPLAPASASDNVRGGVLLLHSLLDATGGNSAEAAAGYFQGLPSVQQNGEYSSTQQYVQDILSLENQFGGGG